MQINSSIGDAWVLGGGRRTRVAIFVVSVSRAGWDSETNCHNECLIRIHIYFSRVAVEQGKKIVGGTKTSIELLLLVAVGGGA